MLESLRGKIVAMPPTASPRSAVVLLIEGARPIVLDRKRTQPALHGIGLHVDGLDEILSEVAASPQDDGLHYPVIVLIEGWAQCAFVEATALTRGGDA